jgi:hypothetical protein
MMEMGKWQMPMDRIQSPVDARHGWWEVGTVTGGRARTLKTTHHQTEAHSGMPHTVAVRAGVQWIVRLCGGSEAAIQWVPPCIGTKLGTSNSS